MLAGGGTIRAVWARKAGGVDGGRVEFMCLRFLSATKSNASVRRCIVGVALS